MGFNLKDFRAGGGSDDDHHSWDVSPRRLVPASNETDEVQIPDPALCKGISLPTGSYSSGAIGRGSITATDIEYPSTEHLATHLLLVECFYKLKTDVIRSESLERAFGLRPSDTVLKWSLFLKAAVSRFDLWWQSIPNIIRHATAYASHGGAQRLSSLSKEYLPPLDVLLIWYSYILQPSYAADCEKFQKESVFALCFPWSALYEVIDRKTLEYTLPKSAAILFKKMSSQETDLISCLTSPPPYTESTARQYSVDLEDTVRKLDDFIDETHSHLWIRSPACTGSLARSVERYRQFLFLMPNPETSLDRTNFNPPWDIQLVINTHRLYPINFQSFLDNSFGPQFRGTFYERFCDGDSRRPPEKPSNPINELWKRQFGTEYCSCFCWICESIKDATTTTEGPSASGLSRKVVKEMQQLLRFHYSVENMRQAGQRLPCPLFKGKEQEEEKWEVEMGPAYHEVIIPAKYDRHGKMVKEERRKVVREKGYTSGINWTMAL